MKRNSLTRPEDLVAQESTETPEELHAKLSGNLRVLEQSLQAQQQVAQQFKDTPAQFAAANRFLEAMQESYFELRLEAAVLDLEVLLGNKLQVAAFLERMALQIRNPPQEVPMTTDPTPPGENTNNDTSGTQVAGEQDTSDSTDETSDSADTTEEPVH